MPNRTEEQVLTLSLTADHHHIEAHMTCTCTHVRFVPSPSWPEPRARMDRRVKTTGMQLVEARERERVGDRERCSDKEEDKQHACYTPALLMS